LIRHSAPFVDIDNYEDYKNVKWCNYNRNMILSVKGEENAKKLCNVEELKNIDDIYASDSFRAIGTAKYISEQNDLKIKLDSRINERDFGVERIADLPDNFNKLSFDNKNFKINKGESLNNVDNRFKSFINDILDTNSSKFVIILHGIILLSYLETICNDFKFDGKNFDIKFKNNIILNGIPKNPSIYKIEFNENREIINVECMECDV